MAKVVVQNSLFDGKWKLSSFVVPAVMYTDPEYAVVNNVITLDENGHVVPTSQQQMDPLPGIRLYCTRMEKFYRGMLLTPYSIIRAR